MSRTISKAGIAAVAALSLGAALVASTEPAAAQWRYGGGGWHGGGWHSGYSWHPGYWRGGYYYNGWWGPAVAAGVLAGAAIATAPYWGSGAYAYGDPCWQVRPVYSPSGVWLGNRPVNVCQ